MTKNSLSKFDLRNALNRQSFNHAVICSFTFDPTFFEEYCLEKFSTLSNNGNITVFVDSNIYNEIILGPESSQPEKANLRYLLHPVSVRGIFHPKLFLLASKNKGKLIVGSANFTRSGLTSNAELIGYYEYEAEKNEEHILIFQQAFEYIQKLAQNNSSKSLDSNIQEIARDARWLIRDEESKDDSESLLIHNLEIPLWSQIIDGIESPVDKVSVLSRYFDGNPSFLDKIINDLNPEKIYIYTQNGVTNMTPNWLEHPSVKNGRTEILICNYEDNGYLQPLHAKAVAIESKNECRLAYGSANFSSPALLRTSYSGNAEIMIKLSGLSTADFQPNKFFDPDKTAKRLVDASILITSISDEEEITTEKISHQIKISEAVFEDTKDNERILINIEKIPSDLDNFKLNCKLKFRDQIVRNLKIHQKEENFFYAKTPVEIKKLLNESSTIVQLEIYDNEDLIADSNCLFLSNLKDIKTDKPIRRERHIKEAQQSAVQFFNVLRDLIGSSDKDDLLTFLNHCDIPLSDYARPNFFREARPVWDGGEGMRNLGDRNLKIYTELHFAAMAFFDKHFKKLQKHTKNQDINGIENFLHIFLAMGGILRSQVERAVIGLESKNSPATIKEWSDCRKHVDIYFARFKELMDCLWNEYLSNMVKIHNENSISEKFAPDLQAIQDICVDMLSYRERVEKVRTTTLKHRNDTGKIITPSYFHCVFNPAHWRKYSSEIESNYQAVESTIIVATS